MVRVRAMTAQIARHSGATGVSSRSGLVAGASFCIAIGGLVMLLE